MRKYLCIDLKSFYASVECVERGLDPLTVNLVVADESRTEKTICLAVTPALKSYGVPGRARLFEVIQKVKQINLERLSKAPQRRFTGKSCSDIQLKNDPSLELDYIVAPPRMAHYMYFSTQIYKIYLKYVAAEDIHVYSIDEVFMDITHYLSPGVTAEAFARTIISDVLRSTGITATAGIGTNMYLAKVAMDIVAKKMPADENGVRIAELDEMSYRCKLWDHRPLTDFWRVGRGIARRLESNGLYTMGDIALCSHYCEDRLYALFGKNAELLIDHAWGWEPCTIAEVKAYKPRSNSVSSGQVLSCPYEYSKARIVVGEMMDNLALELFRKGVVTSRLVLDIGYDAESLSDTAVSKNYKGEVYVDHYGRVVPKHAHGTVNLPKANASATVLSKAILDLYDKIVCRNFLVRKISIAACSVSSESEIREGSGQLSLFDDNEALELARKESELAMEREKKIQEAVLGIKDRYGKNAIIKGMNLCDGATAISRNSQIGGHHA